jgi:hypothetical protein
MRAAKTITRAGDDGDAAVKPDCHEWIPWFFFLLWEKVARMQSAPDEGSVAAERDPSPGFISLRSISPPSPTRGEGTKAQQKIGRF